MADDSFLQSPPKEEQMWDEAAAPKKRRSTQKPHWQKRTATTTTNDSIATTELWTPSEKNNFFNGMVVLGWDNWDQLHTHFVPTHSPQSLQHWASQIFRSKKLFVECVKLLFYENEQNTELLHHISNLIFSPKSNETTTVAGRGGRPDDSVSWTPDDHKRLVQRMDAVAWSRWGVVEKGLVAALWGGPKDTTHNVSAFKTTEPPPSIQNQNVPKPQHSASESVELAWFDEQQMEPNKNENETSDMTVEVEHSWFVGCVESDGEGEGDLDVLAEAVAQGNLTDDQGPTVQLVLTETERTNEAPLFSTEAAPDAYTQKSDTARQSPLPEANAEEGPSDFPELDLNLFENDE